MCQYNTTSLCLSIVSKVLVARSINPLLFITRSQRVWQLYQGTQHLLRRGGTCPALFVTWSVLLRTQIQDPDDWKESKTTRTQVSKILLPTHRRLNLPRPNQKVGKGVSRTRHYRELNEEGNTEHRRSRCLRFLVDGLPRRWGFWNPRRLSESFRPSYVITEVFRYRTGLPRDGPDKVSLGSSDHTHKTPKDHTKDWYK